MRISHIFIHGDNLNSLCDFYSFVFDCEIILSEKDPSIVFDNYKFVFKKVLGTRNNILPSFSLELSDEEYEALKARLSLYYYKAGIDYQPSAKLEINDPCGNIFLIHKVDSNFKAEQIVRNC